MSYFHTMLYCIEILWLCVFSAAEWGIHTCDLSFCWKLPLPVQCDVLLRIHYSVLSHHASKITELCDWLQFFTIDHYSQLSTFPPWRLHNFGLFHIYPHVVFLWRLLECIHYALKSTLGMRDHSLVICKTDRFYQHTFNFDPFLYICKSFVYDMLDVNVDIIGDSGQPCRGPWPIS